MKQASGVRERYQLQKANGENIDVRSKHHCRSGQKGIDAAKMNGALLEVPLKTCTTREHCWKCLSRPAPRHALLYGSSASTSPTSART